MAVIERDVVLMSKDSDGNQTIDFPMGRLGHIEGDADVKTAPEAADFIPLMDNAANGQMKKTTVGALVSKPMCVAVTLSTSGWTGDGPYTQTVTASGVTASNAVTPSPVAESWDAAGKAGVYCSAQAENSLTFTCSKRPDMDITYNVMVQEVG